MEEMIIDNYSDIINKTQMLQNLFAYFVRNKCWFSFTIINDTCAVIRYEMNDERNNVLVKPKDLKEMFEFISLDI